MRVENEAVKRLKERQKNGDPEAAHAAADQVLCDMLTDLGYEAVVKQYARVKKWYA